MAMPSMDMGNMPGMQMGPTTTSHPVVGPTLMAPPPASLTMDSQAMASAIAHAPQAGMYDMATMQNMCSLPGMGQMCQNTTRLLIAVTVALMALATMAVVLRLLSRRVSALTYWWDDTAILAALLFSYACSALTIVDAKHGVGRHFETVREGNIILLLKTTVAYQVLYSICISLVKISILLFYNRIFGVRKAFEKVIYIAISLVLCWCVASVLVNILKCIPIEAAWIRPYPHSQCINSNASLLGTAITNIFLDFGILVLPIEPIWRLNLTLRKKLALTAIFFVGAFICGAAIVRVWAIQNINQTDVTWSYVRPLTWSGVEISIGITCACLPILQPLLQTTLGPCLGRVFASSSSHPTTSRNTTTKHNYHNNRKDSGHGHPQMARRATSEEDRFSVGLARWPGIEERKESEGSGSGRGSRAERERGPLTTWTEIEGGEGGCVSDDAIPLKGIQVTSLLEMDTRLV